MRRAAALAVLALALLVAGTAGATQPSTATHHRAAARRAAIEPGGCLHHGRISDVYCKHHRRHHHRRHHSRFTPDWGAAHYWTGRYFGHHTWQQRLVMCFARHESGFVLAAVHTNTPVQVYGHDDGPWQVNDKAHTWVTFYKLVRSWKYATAVTWHLSGQGANDFSAWRGEWGNCGYSG